MQSPFLSLDQHLDENWSIEFIPMIGGSFRASRVFRRQKVQEITSGFPHCAGSLLEGETETFPILPFLFWDAQ